MLCPDISDLILLQTSLIKGGSTTVTSPFPSHQGRSPTRVTRTPTPPLSAPFSELEVSVVGDVYRPSKTPNVYWFSPTSVSVTPMSVGTNQCDNHWVNAVWEKIFPVISCRTIELKSLTGTYIPFTFDVPNPLTLDPTHKS